MTTEFKSLFALNDYFKDEKTCYQYLAQIIWPDGKAFCPHCGSTDVYPTKSRSKLQSKKHVPEYRCRDKKCSKKFSILTGTVMESTHIPLKKWFAAMWLLLTTTKGVTSRQLHLSLGVTRKSAWFLAHRIREMFRMPITKLSGTVEIDETYVGGINDNRHWDKKLEGHSGFDYSIGLIQRDPNRDPKDIGKRKKKKRK